VVDWRATLLLLAMGITDATWLWLIVGLIGLLAGQGGAPLSWPVVLVVLLAGSFFTRFVYATGERSRKLTAIHGAVGLLVVYVAIAAAHIDGRDAIDIAWGARFFTGPHVASEILGTIVCMFAGAYLWRHATTMATCPSPPRRMATSFKLGLVVIAVTLVVELASGVDLGAQRVMVVFFAASLAGLATSRIPPGSVPGAEWIRVLAATVVVTLALGIALGFTAGAFGRGGLELVWSAWGYLSDALLWGVRILLSSLLEALGTLAAWLHLDGWFAGGVGEPGALPPSWSSLDLDSNPSLVDNISKTLQNLFLLALIYPLYRVFAFARKHAHHHYSVYRSERHESIRGDAAVLSDFIRMMRTLFPGSIKPGEIDRTARGEPGIVEVIGLYYDLLSHAVLRGYTFVPAATPLERVGALEQVLPAAPVAEITRRFVAACYGQEITDELSVAALRKRLEGSI
jgi:hypothetical protein